MQTRTRWWGGWVSFFCAPSSSSPALSSLPRWLGGFGWFGGFGGGGLSVFGGGGLSVFGGGGLSVFGGFQKWPL